ncbi:helix-turn-helix domain-containing protein [Clostridiaceae bacterium 35-E11]
MKAVLVLRDLEQIKAIAHPYRLEILKCFEEEQPATTKQVADKIGEPHAKVNYHIKTLQKVNILELVDERVKSGIIEKYYLPSARMFIVDKSIINFGRHEKSINLHQVSLSDFENIAKDYYKTIESIDEKTENQSKHLYYGECHFTAEDAETLRERLQNTIEEFMKEKNDNKKKNTTTYSITSLLVPKEMGKNK